MHFPFKYNSFFLMLTVENPKQLLSRGSCPLQSQALPNLMLGPKWCLIGAKFGKIVKEKKEGMCSTSIFFFWVSFPFFIKGKKRKLYTTLLLGYQLSKMEKLLVNMLSTHTFTSTSDVTGILSIYIPKQSAQPIIYSSPVAISCRYTPHSSPPPIHRRAHYIVYFSKYVSLQYIRSFKFNEWRHI